MESKSQAPSDRDAYHELVTGLEMADVVMIENTPPDELDAELANIDAKLHGRVREANAIFWKDLPEERPPFIVHPA